MCCMRLTGNAGRKNRHLGTIAQLCPAISLQLKHVSTIGKKLLNSNIANISSTSPQYGELRPTNGWDLLASLGHPSTFQPVSRLGFVLHQRRSMEVNKTLQDVWPSPVLVQYITEFSLLIFNSGHYLHSDGDNHVGHRTRFYFSISVHSSIIKWKKNILNNFKMFQCFILTWNRVWNEIKMF